MAKCPSVLHSLGGLRHINIYCGPAKSQVSQGRKEEGERAGGLAISPCWRGSPTHVTDEEPGAQRAGVNSPGRQDPHPAWQPPGLVAGLSGRDQENARPLGSEACRYNAPGCPGPSPVRLRGVMLEQESEKSAGSSDDSDNLCNEEAGGSGQHFWWVSPRFLEGCVTLFCLVSTNLTVNRDLRSGWHLSAHLSPQRLQAGRWGPSTCQGWGEPSPSTDGETEAQKEKGE